ncbi:MAG: Crp/Fnr family transcriptional regulator [Clostridium sp.]
MVKEIENNSSNINKLFNAYPILREINNKNNKVIENHVFFSKLEEGQYLSSLGNQCAGILFVVSGTIKIHKINEEGEETNLYNIEKGELCHEALSCMVKCESLNIVAKSLVNSEVFIMNMDLAKNILIKDKDFLEYMYKDLYLKFSNILSNKEKIIHEDLQTRLIKLLISKNTKIVYSKHSELAFEIDSTRESVSRKLKSLEVEGYLKMSRGKIEILKNLEELIIL